MALSRQDDETTFSQWEMYGQRTALMDHMDGLAAERLTALWPLSFDQLAEVEPEPLEVSGPWWAKGRLRTEVKDMEDGTLRVKVLWGVRYWWWMGYYKAYAGFYRARYGDSTPAVENFSLPTPVT